ncbi:hypothetical protein EV2_016320 [Malus domestica]
MEGRGVNTGVLGLVVEELLEEGDDVWLRRSVLIHPTLMLESTGQTGCDALTLAGVDGGAALLLLCSPISFALWAIDSESLLQLRP